MGEEDTCPEGTCWLKGSFKNASALKRDMGKLGNKQPHFTEAQEKKTPLYVWPKMPRAGEGGVSQTRQNENLPQTRELASATRSQGSGRHLCRLRPLSLFLGPLEQQLGEAGTGKYFTYCELRGLLPRMAANLVDRGIM